MSHDLYLVEKQAVVLSEPLVKGLEIFGNFIFLDVSHRAIVIHLLFYWPSDRVIPSLASHTQVGRFDRIVIQQHLAFSTESNPASLEDICVICKLERILDMLFHQQDSDSPLPDFVNYFEFRELESGRSPEKAHRASAAWDGSSERGRSPAILLLSP